MSLNKPKKLEWALIGLFAVFAAGKVYLWLHAPKPAVKPFAAAPAAKP